MNMIRTKAAFVLIFICLGAVACTKSLIGVTSKKGPVALATIEPLGKNTVKGTFMARENKSGAVTVEIQVEGLVAGRHGAHIHSGGSCGDAGKAAGPHWDPASSNKHGNPKDPATMHHAADMPNIDVDAQGRGTMRFQTTNFKLSDLNGKTIVVHENTDNYMDSPANGGSGARIGCGVIQVSGGK